jgi:hypothetical protein
MSLFGSLKDAVVGQAMKLASSPRVTKLVSDPRLMNVAMRAMSVGGTVKSNMDKAGRVAATVFGLATQDEVANLRSTIQNLEDQLAVLETKAGQPGGGQMDVSGAASAEPERSSSAAANP